MVKTSAKIEINPLLIKKLRESVGYSKEALVKKGVVKNLKKIEDVESGKDSFTLNQLKKLVNIYRIPLAALFTEEIPKLPEIPDYRINREKKLTHEVYFAIRRASYLSSKLFELTKKQNQIPYFPEDLNAKDLANAFKKYLNLKPLKSKKPAKILEFYKKILEEKLLILIIEYPLKADDVRAFSILSDISVIVLNEQDESQIKLFSTFHEICHLLKKSGGVCSIEVDNKQRPEVEFYCDEFAAEFLVPQDIIHMEVERVGTDNKGVADLSKIFGVSKQVIMLRLLKLGHIRLNSYRQFKERFDEEKIKKKKFGRRKWEKVYFNRAGNLAIQEVSNAYKKGDITFLESAEILNLKAKYVEKFVT